MTLPRAYYPIEDAILYHYCSPETFLVICSGKKLRFCDIFSMNDYLEMHWGYRVWENAATQVHDTVGIDFLDRIDAVFSGSGAAALPLASCLSTDGDTLSQWRAYSQDGLGFCIGFDAKTLLRLPVTPLRVCYSEAEQVTEVADFVLALHKLMQADPGNDDLFFELTFKLAMDLSAYKNPAFDEEKEVRLLHLVRFQRSGQGNKLVDEPGIAFGSHQEALPVKFFMKEGAPVPHLDLTFIGPDGESPIREVIIGPKNQSLTSAISIMLETLGLTDVQVTRSRASYR